MSQPFCLWAARCSCRPCSTAPQPGAPSTRLRRASNPWPEVRMQFELTDEQRELRRGVRDFAEGRLREWCERTEASGESFPREVIDLMRDHDLIGVDVPVE